MRGLGSIAQSARRVRRILAAAGLALLAGAGSPVFAGEEAFDLWNPRFGIPGVRGEVHALIEFEGDLVVAGVFTEAGHELAANVAMWRDDTWRSMGAFDGPVHALEIFDGTLYAGGAFTEADGSAAPGLARWNGSAWTGLAGAGLTSAGAPVRVQALAAFGDRLLIGGAFARAGGELAGGLAWWRPGDDCQPWPGWSGGSESVVRALEPWREGFVAGGRFRAEVHDPGTVEELVDTENVAFWQGPQDPPGRGWLAMADGIPGEVFALLADGDNLFVGGRFQLSVEPASEGGPDRASNIASWNGDRWTALGRGTSGDDPVVSALAFHRDELVAGGRFEVAGDLQVGRVAAWDGTRWGRLSSGVRGFGWIHALVPFRSLLAAGGSFDRAGGHGSASVAVLGGFWNPLGRSDGMDGPVRGLRSGGQALLVGGGFSSAGAHETSGFALWESDTWIPYDGELNDDVLCVEESGISLWVGGLFTRYVGGTVRHVVEWTGTEWDSPRGGVEAGVRALVHHDGSLYAGGDFTRAGGRDRNYVARWGGHLWHELGAGTNGSVHALESDGVSLFAGGDFSRAGDSTTVRMARWDGLRWHPVGPGLDDTVLVLLARNAGLYAGGEFGATGDGETALAHVAVWDGATWSPLGEGFNGPVHALAWHDGRLVAGGSFTHSGSRETRGLAWWDGARWNRFLPGVGGESTVVHALASRNGSLFVGGEFTQAGARVSSFLAEWQGSITRAVWPGDTDDSGTVDVYDVLPLGRFWQRTGPSRAGQDVAWAPQAAPEWGSPLAAHADADGDGRVDAGDLSAVLQNWGRRQDGLEPMDGVPVEDAAVIATSLLSADLDLPAEMREMLEAIAGKPAEPSESPRPRDLMLQVSPRPARVGEDGVSIRFELPGAGLVRVEVFDVTGRQVDRVFAGPLPSGPHQLRWGTPASARVPAGLYFVRVSAGGETRTARVILLE